MTEWVQNVLNKWTAEGVKINPGADIIDIESVERVLSFEFPSDFKEFYLNINGFHSLDWQEHMFTLWSLNMIIEEYQHSNDKDFIGFSDFLLASHCIGFRRSKKGIYKVANSINYRAVDPIANTFKEVIGLINTSTGDIY